MIRRRTTLQEALAEIDAEVLQGVTAIVVNGGWWQTLPGHEQSAYRRRCATLGIDLRADSALSRHFVELASDTAEPPLSTERRV